MQDLIPALTERQRYWLEGRKGWKEGVGPAQLPDFIGSRQEN
jgi:hypothetical protein